MWKRIALVLVVVAGCKKEKPAVCVEVDACCKSLEADAKAFNLGTPTSDAYDKACTAGTEGLTQNHCADYARTLKMSMGAGAQVGVANPTKMTPACRDMNPYPE